MSGPRPVLWGILNVTPDSFSDGGRFDTLDSALAQADNLLASGAQIIDVGGESTRPGATRVDPTEEIRRVIPVIHALVAAGHTVSVDTMNAGTAREAIGVGVHIVNDVSGGLADPRMLSVVAESDAQYVIMHWRGHSVDMDERATYTDVVTEVTGELAIRLDAACAAGIALENIILDPGIGFAKNSDQNWALLSGVSAIGELGCRVLVGASRKRFLGELLPAGHEMTERDRPSAVVSVMAAECGVWGLRVHEPRVHTEALDVWQAVREGRRA